MMGQYVRDQNDLTRIVVA